MRAGGASRKGERFAILSGEVEEELRRLTDIRRETLEVIAGIQDNTLAALLIAYYVNDLPWHDVAAELHYTGNYVRYTLHRRALAAAQEVLDEREVKMSHADVLD